jgi:hypothetical protein
VVAAARLPASDGVDHDSAEFGAPPVAACPISCATWTRFARRGAAPGPATVAEQLAEIVRDSGTNYLLLVFSFGDLALERSMRSMQLFVAEVMPALRSAWRRAGRSTPGRGRSWRRRGSPSP